MNQARRNSLRGLLCACGLVALGTAGIWAGGAAAQSADDEPTPLKLKLKRSIDASDVKGGVAIKAQVEPTKYRRASRKEIARPHSGAGQNSNSQGGNGGVAFYPGDLTYQGGPVVESAVSHNIYVNCDASCFGNPGVFLTRLGTSQFLHLADQFVGTGGGHRYTMGQGGTISYSVTPGTALGPDDILTLVHVAASYFGSGYGHIYHIYFAPGIDVCADPGLTVCYSPDNFATWYFCAFHSSVDFTDIGHALYTVEPFQNVDGCAVGQPSPNGSLVDSQASVLSHEFFELITDPDGDAWWNLYDLDLAGYEIGDECQNLTFVYPNVSISGHSYEVQPEYSNSAHGCTYRPSSD